MKLSGNWKKYIGQAAVLLCVTAALCCFAARKEGYHMDELLSFELSNAEYNPWIVPTQPVGRLAKFMREEIQGESLGETLANLADTVEDVLRNRGGSRLLQYKADVYPEPVWIDSGMFTDYITTGKTDRFNYLSVYFNVKDDNHPPLHFMLLHTMSSLFPGVIAPFQGCLINILAILGCVLLLFRLGGLLEAGGMLPDGYGRSWGVCAGLLYGVCAGGIATALLIRMYGLMTFFCVALFYLHVKKWLEGVSSRQGTAFPGQKEEAVRQKKGFAGKNTLLAAVTVLGFWTQYFFLFYCLTLALVTVVLLARDKRRGELRAYMKTMILAAVIGVAGFPFALQDVFSSGRGQEALQNLGQGLSGYGTRLAAFGRLLLEASFGNAILGICVLLILAACGVLLYLKGRPEKRMGEKRATLSFWALLLVPFVCYFLLAARMSPYLVDRYIMPLFPFSAMILTLVSVKIRGIWRKIGKYVTVVSIILLAVFNVLTYDGEYLYQGYERQLAVAEQYEELPCVCLYDGYGFYYNLIEFTRYDRTLLTTLPELEQRQDTSGLTEPEQVVVLRKSGVEEQKALSVLAGYGWEVEQVLLEEADSVYGDTLYLCGRVGQASLPSGD